MYWIPSPHRHHHQSQSSTSRWSVASSTHALSELRRAGSQQTDYFIIIIMSTAIIRWFFLIHMFGATGIDVDYLPWISWGIINNPIVCDALILQAAQQFVYRAWLSIIIALVKLKDESLRTTDASWSGKPHDYEREKSHNKLKLFHFFANSEKILMSHFHLMGKKMLTLHCMGLHMHYGTRNVIYWMFISYIYRFHGHDYSSCLS